MAYKNMKVIARNAVVKKKKLDGIEKHMLIVPPGKLELSMSTNNTEETIVLVPGDKTEDLIIIAEKEPGEDNVYGDNQDKWGLRCIQ